MRLPRRDPAEAGLDPNALAAATEFAVKHEIPWPRDLRSFLESGHFEPAPANEVLGPLPARGPTNGLILRHGAVVVEWGDPLQIDVTFSVAKSYLSLLAGIAFTDGLIGDLDAPVRESVRDGGFNSAQNAPITWRHLLQQTSEWEGELFGKSDIVDRNRRLATEGANTMKGQFRPLQAPGTFWEYNDVRVNRLSLSLLRLFRRPLPEVFAERIMRPIGASETWRWHGYRTSVVEVGGRMIESVSGGSHWGGGVQIHAEDQARIGLLMLNRGRWDGRQVVPEAWIAESLIPCALNPEYGLLWWLNGTGKIPTASRQSFFAVGAGGNRTWIDPESGIVGVMRWLDPAAVDQFIALVNAAMETSAARQTASA